MFDKNGGIKREPYSQKAAKDYTETYKFLDSVSFYCPEIGEISAALTMQPMAYETARLKHREVEVAPQSTENLRPGLRALTKLVITDAVRDLSENSQRHRLTPNEQVLVELRARTNDPVSKVCSQLWDYIRPYFEQGRIVLPYEFADSIPKLAKISLKKVGDPIFGAQKTVFEIQLDQNFADKINAQDARQALIIVDRLISMFCRYASLHVLKEIQQGLNQHDQAKLALTRLRGGLENIIFAGFGQGIGLTAYSLLMLYELASEDGTLRITPEMSQKMAKEHVKFLLPMTTWNLNSFAILGRHLAVKPDSAVLNFLFDWLELSASKQQEHRFDFFLRKECFQRLIQNDEKFAAVPILDFNLQGFSDAQLLELAAPLTPFGCPATPFLPAFISNLCSMLEKSVFRPFLKT